MADNKSSARRVLWPALIILAVVIASCSSQSQLADGEPTANDSATQSQLADGESTDNDAAALPQLPGDLAEASWVEVTPTFPELPDGQTIRISDSISDGETVWAVGHVSNEYRNGGFFGLDLSQTQAMIWRSADGQDWEAVDIGLDPLPAEVGDFTNRAALYKILSTDDGALWAFGRTYGENETEQTTRSLIAYRSEDGETWEPLEVAVDGREAISIASYDSLGDTVALKTWEPGISDADGPTELFTTDGSSWTARPAASDGYQIVIQDLPTETMENSALPGEEPAPHRIARSSDFAVITGVTALDPFVDENGQSWPGFRLTTWVSNGDEWLEVDRPERFRVNEEVVDLVSYDEGVFVVVEGSPIRDGDPGGPFLWDIDSSGTVADLGLLPTAFCHEMFVVGDQFVIIGGESELGAPQYSIWVAEFP